MSNLQIKFNYLLRFMFFLMIQTNNIKFLEIICQHIQMKNCSWSQSDSESLQKYSNEGETQLFSSLLKPMTCAPKTVSADWDLDAKIEEEKELSADERPLSFPLQADDKVQHPDLKKNDSFVDFITVHIVNKELRSLESQQMISEMPVGSPQNRFSRRGLSLVEEEEQFLESIQISQIQRWLLLIFCACCNAMVPIWMTVDVKSEGLTRSGWRIFVLSIMLIPFAMAEQKHISDPEEKFRNLIKPSHLKKIYLSSLSYCIWLVFGIMAIRFTARAHSFCLLRCKFYWITIRKLYNNHECHEGEIGGLLLVSIGILMMFWDSIALPVLQIPIASYVGFSWEKRLFGDLFSVGGCLILVSLDKKWELPKGPRFSTLIIYYFFCSMNMVILGYYIGGTEFSFDPRRGVLGLFTSVNFVGVFYVSIMLGINLVMANVMVNHIFSQVIRNMASCFEMVLVIGIYHILNIEKVHTGTTMLGVCFLVPGMMMIVGGQGTLQKLQMKINSQIYTTQKVIVSNENQFTEIILKPISNQIPSSHRISGNFTQIKQSIDPRDDPAEKSQTLFRTFKYKQD